MHQNMPISLFKTLFDHFHFHPPAGIIWRVILKPCHIHFSRTWTARSRRSLWTVEPTLFDHFHFHPPAGIIWRLYWNCVLSSPNGHLVWREDYLILHISSPFQNAKNWETDHLSDIDIEFTNPPWLPPFHCLQVKPLKQKKKYFMKNYFPFFLTNQPAWMPLDPSSFLQI